MRSVNSRSGRGRLRLITGVAAVAVVAGGVWAWRAFTPRQAQAETPTASPTHGEFVVNLTAAGVLQSDDAVTVSTGKAGGELLTILPDGAIVRAGDVFCTIAARDLERQEVEAQLAYDQAREEIERTRESSQADFENAKRAVEQARQDIKVWEESNRVRVKQAADQLEFDRAELERLRLESARKRRMADKGIIAGSEADIAQAVWQAQEFKVKQSEKDLELRRQEIDSEVRRRASAVTAVENRANVSSQRISRSVRYAQARAETASKALTKLQAALADRTIKCPTAGIVTMLSRFRGGERRALREGDVVGVNTPLGSISSSEKVSVRCRVREDKIGYLRKGETAQIEFEALPGRRFAGVVSSVGAVARSVEVYEDPAASPGDRVFDVLVKVVGSGRGQLKPGLNAKAQILVKRLPEALSVPLETVVERGGKSFVYVRRGARFVSRQVQLGERSDVAVVVRSGLADSDQVMIIEPARGYRQPAPGSADAERGGARTAS